MKNNIKLILAIFSIILLNSCSTYIPNLQDASEYPKSVKGAYIELTCLELQQFNQKYIQKTKNQSDIINFSKFKGDIPTITGELIAADTAGVYILTQDIGYDNIKADVFYPRQLVKIKYNKLINYTVTYANNQSLKAFNVIMFLSPISHGFFLLLTYPLNMIGAMIVNSNSFYYKMSELPENRLYYFCRFPQGLPPGIPLDSSF